MNDFKPFKHGEEGTHGCCNKRMKKEGLQSHCCYCVPHEGCEYVLPSVAKDSHSTPTPVKKYCTHKNPTMQALYPSLVPVCIKCKLPSTHTPTKRGEEFIGKTKRVWYQKGIRDGLTRAIELFSKHHEVMTENVVILELKALRGDYDALKATQEGEV